MVEGLRRNVWRIRLTGPTATVALLLMSTAATGQTQPSDPTPQPPLTLSATVDVIGTTPLPGTGIDRDKVPANVQSLTSSDLATGGSASLVNSLTDQASGVNVNATMDDPFQPDLLYRGFAASPVLGTPQGLAVYQNGVRVNEAYGDTVNWDLIPDIAIDRVDLVSANPVYGLNALGGAVIVAMKSGFTHQGFASEFTGGSFGQRSGSFEYGRQGGRFAAYVAGRLFDADGWRQFSSDRVRQLYGDVSAHSGRGFFDLSFTGASNDLLGEGPSPVQELAVNRSLVFTSPQDNANRLAFGTINGSYQATRALAFQSNAYVRHFSQTVANGNTTNYTGCASSAALCQSDGATPLVGAGGSFIPDLSQGGSLPIGENDREAIHGLSVGGSLQATNTAALFGHENHVVVGGSLDRATFDFQSSEEVGLVNSSLQVLPSGFFVTTPENTGFSATPVRLGGTDTYSGLFITDTFNLRPTIAITASGRFNVADIALVDHLGPNLSGSTRYSRFNPAIGGTYKVATGVTAYVGYAEGNRVPTPSEIECSDPTQPCLLPSSLSADPPLLKQVVSHTYETGLRGSFLAGRAVGGRVNWNVGLFRTHLTDDIYGVATSISAGFFENIGATRRQGLESGLTYKNDHWSVYGTFDLVDATFESALTMLSPHNPFADANGDLHVLPGDRLPGIPQHQLKVGVTYRLTPKWTAGGVLTNYGDQYLRGDEANLNAPLPAYTVVNLHSTYQVTKHIEAFATVQNLLNAHYTTFGEFGDPTGIGTPGIPADAVTNGPGVDNRFESPSPPIAAFGGIHVRF